ncbi:hypothetical protein RHSIM_Rhsim13G0141700 [Rhododendron simsii]|uniref:Transposase-associated domain-containing protein n=1 Tax=Rhododendron simsii TaxID=118357 RepID=A0A834FXK8_RHOSS|nr:hypothetical protein RHSIM_Rhsim13G0141700 [Rhododendron simsii]
MDKSWMYKSRLTSEYLNRVEGFLNFAFQKESIYGKIVCPCVMCGNGRWVTRSEAVDHLVCDGFIKGYTKWIAHGEALSSTTTAPIHTNSGNALGTNNSMLEMQYDTFGISNRDIGMDDVPNNVELSNADAKKFYKMVSDAQKPLYPRCKEFSKLSLLVELFHNKCLEKWTNDSFTRLLRTFNRVLREGEKFPNSYYQAKKVLGELGLLYKNIHACPNDCMLYWKEHIDDTECHVCHEWWLQRLFMSSKIASFMKWHDEGRTKDGCMRHPTDSPACQTFDFQHKEFATDSRNVRLGLASNGFNPFGMMSNVHSTWPVILMPYNLSPWMCMKQLYFIMLLLIPDRSAPGNNIDVYLQPLIEELKESWGVRVDTLDASTNQNFKMHAALMWTINDFPAYANLSGWSTKGRFAFPSCHKDTCSSWLKYSGKHIYMDHRRFLEDSYMYLATLKSYVRNKNRPEGSIAKGYLAKECLTFCSRYLEDVETRFNRVGRNDDEGSTIAARLPIFSTQGWPFGKVATETLDQETLVMALQYVLFNCDVVDKFSKFHTREVERRRKFQNSGAVVTATTIIFSSASDNNPVAGDIAYYGILTDVIELSYFGGRKVVLFKCDWMSEGKNRRPDEHGFTLVNFARLVHVNEPFVLASQVQQAFYVANPLDKGWHVVIRTTARDAFNMNIESCIDDMETYESCDGQLQDDQGDINLVREDVEGTTVDTIDATTAQVVEGDGVEGI